MLMKFLMFPFRVHAMMAIFIVEEDVAPHMSMYLTMV
jgi:hypothetical protein